MPTKDYYRILGLAPTADAVAIKLAYRRLAHAYHPDRNGAAGAEDRFKEIAEAYAVLGNATLRVTYDRRCGCGPDGFDRASFETWFDHIFGGAPHPRHRRTPGRR